MIRLSHFDYSEFGHNLEVLVDQSSPALVCPDVGVIPQVMATATRIIVPTWRCGRSLRTAVRAMQFAMAEHKQLGHLYIWLDLLTDEIPIVAMLATEGVIISVRRWVQPTSPEDESRTGCGPGC